MPLNLDSRIKNLKILFVGFKRLWVFIGFKIFKFAIFVIYPKLKEKKNSEGSYFRTAPIETTSICRIDA